MRPMTRSAQSFESGTVQKRHGSEEGVQTEVLVLMEGFIRPNRRQDMGPP